VLEASGSGISGPKERSSVSPEDTISAANHVYQFVQTGTCSAWENGSMSSGRAYLWIPDHCKKLRGLLVLSPNVPEQKLAGDPGIRAACEANDLGIVFISGLLHFSCPQAGREKTSGRNGCHRFFSSAVARWLG
jgi:hypothetical protein